MNQGCLRGQFGHEHCGDKTPGGKKAEAVAVCIAEREQVAYQPNSKCDPNGGQNVGGVGKLPDHCAGRENDDGEGKRVLFIRQTTPGQPGEDQGQSQQGGLPPKDRVCDKRQVLMKTPDRPGFRRLEIDQLIQFASDLSGAHLPAFSIESLINFMGAFRIGVGQ